MEFWGAVTSVNSSHGLKVELHRIRCVHSPGMTFMMFWLNFLSEGLSSVCSCHQIRRNYTIYVCLCTWSAHLLRALWFRLIRYILSSHIVCHIILFCLGLGDETMQGTKIKLSMEITCPLFCIFSNREATTLWAMLTVLGAWAVSQPKYSCQL